MASSTPNTPAAGPRQRHEGLHCDAGLLDPAFAGYRLAAHRAVRTETPLPAAHAVQQGRTPEDVFFAKAWNDAHAGTNQLLLHAHTGALYYLSDARTLMQLRPAEGDTPAQFAKVWELPLPDSGAAVYPHCSMGFAGDNLACLCDGTALHVLNLTSVECVQRVALGTHCVLAAVALRVQDGARRLDCLWCSLPPTTALKHTVVVSRGTVHLDPEAPHHGRLEHTGSWPGHSVPKHLSFLPGAPAFFAVGDTTYGLDDPSVQGPPPDDDRMLVAQSAEEPEACDYQADATVVSCLGADGAPAAHFHLSRQRLLCAIPSPEGPDDLCVQDDLDGIVVRLALDDSTHIDTLQALGYVQASKDKKRFLSVPATRQYAAVIEISRHAFVYTKEGLSLVLDTGTAAPILGVACLPGSIALLTRTSLFTFMLPPDAVPPPPLS